MLYRCWVTMSCKPRLGPDRIPPTISAVLMGSVSTVRPLAAPAAATVEHMCLPKYIVDAGRWILDVWTARLSPGHLPPGPLLPSLCPCQHLSLSTRAAPLPPATPFTSRNRLPSAAKFATCSIVQACTSQPPRCERDRPGPL